MLKTDYVRVPYCKSMHGQEEVDAVIKCLSESTQMGKYSRLFETQIAQLFSKKESLFVNSGSSALYIGIEALDLPSGGEVITPALTFSTTIGCLAKNNLVTVNKNNSLYSDIYSYENVYNTFIDNTFGLVFSSNELKYMDAKNYHKSKKLYVFWVRYSFVCNR